VRPGVLLWGGRAPAPPGWDGIPRRPQAPPRAPDAAGPLPTPPEAFATLRAAETCIHREARGCSCLGAWCELGRRRVRIDRCVACVEAREPY
jgi:hypothetical protein